MRPSSHEIAALVAQTGSIRKAATALGVDESTIRRWIRADKQAVLSSTVTLDSSKVEGMKLLVLDIETQPGEALIWSLWDDRVPLDRLRRETDMMCWAAKWVGHPEVEFRSTFHDSKKIMVHRMHDLLDEADAVIHYNGVRFDVPYLNRSFLDAGLTPPAPFAQIDLLRVVKSRFHFDSNKLAHVSEALGLEGKVSHEGFSLWLKCLNNSVDAWNRMREYNIQDVRLTDALYHKLLPWIDRHPSAGAIMGGEDVCPTCGSDRLESRGYAHTRTGRYRRWVCKQCGKWSRSTKRVAHTKITEVSA